MSVLLAAAPHADTFGYSMPPPGLLRLGGALREHGHAVRLEDLAFRLAAGTLPAGDELADAAAALLLADGAPEVLGLSTMGATLPISLAIARGVHRRARHVPILLGGPGTTGLDVTLLDRFPWISAVVRGEGEATLPELLTRLAAGSTPAGTRGVTWRLGTGEVLREPDRAPLSDLGSLADYAWDLLPPLAAYKEVTGEEEGLTPIDSGRGCVYDCSFCTIGRFWGRRSRPLPVDRLVREIGALRDLPGARRAYLCHDLFGADRRHATALCRALIEADLGVPWECRARVDHLDDELLALMGRAGCYRVLLGVESGDARVRKLHQKNMADDFDVLHVVERCAENGITPILSLILGLPGEDDEALARTFELALDASLAAGCNLSFHLVNPQPGCGLGDSHAASSRPVDGIPPDMALGTGATGPERELIEAHPDVFSTFALLTGERGGVERLRELHGLAGEVPDAMMRAPRTFALAARRRGERALDLARTLRAYGAAPPAGGGFGRFARFVASLGDPLLDDMLAWEQAVDETPAASGPDAGVRVVRARYDLPSVASSLGQGHAPAATPSPTCLAVVSGDRGVRTVRVSADVAELIETPRDALGAEARAFLDSRGLAPR